MFLKNQTLYPIRCVRTFPTVYALFVISHLISSLETNDSVQVG